MCTIAKKKKKKKIIILILGLIAFIGCNQTSHPPDKALKYNFSNKQEAFFRLIEMFYEDNNISSISLNEISYQDRNHSKITGNRLKQYRVLLQEIKIVNGIYRTYDNGIGFGVSAKDSILFGGSAKGYLFSKKEKNPLVYSLDDFEKTYSFEGIRYKKLKKNWYIVYSRW
jgi:hypothetical protein